MDNKERTGVRALSSLPHGEKSLNSFFHASYVLTGKLLEKKIAETKASGPDRNTINI
jgi:hypothetical protein